MVNLNIYGLLGIIEALLVVAVLAVMMFFKWRGASRDVVALRQQLDVTATVTSPPVAVAPPPAATPVELHEPPPEYADFLREQIERSSKLLGEDTQTQAEGAAEAASQDDAELRVRQMLAARHQFLQLELDTQSAPSDEDMQAQRLRIVAGMQALLDGLGWNAAASAAESSEGDAATAGRSEVTKLQEQISHLHTVIDNQHSVMRDLRRLLEEHGGESEELHEALRKLGDAEAQAVELHRCLEVMEHDNARLKEENRIQIKQGVAVSPDAEMLRDLVGNQQRTISKLQNMLRTIGPDTGKASELEEALSKIQRSNNELNSCVMVLEDENAMLRGKIESLQERIAGLEATAEADIDVDALMGSSASGAGMLDEPIEVQEEEVASASVPVVTESITEEKPAAPEEDTDALLADLFGDTPPTSR